MRLPGASRGGSLLVLKRRDEALASFEKRIRLTRS
jgi:hypothetical protein